MRIEQKTWSSRAGWRPTPPGELSSAQWVLIFGSTEIMRSLAVFEDIRRAYPRAYLSGCSTAGEICGSSVEEDTVVVTAVGFDKCRVKGRAFPAGRAADSRSLGERIAENAAEPGLAHLFILSEGMRVNGPELVEGLLNGLPAGVRVSGGFAGDGTRFKETLVMADAPASPDHVAAIGFYGADLRVGTGSLGGWNFLGPERLITRGAGNDLYELDGQSALDLYKSYLGEQAQRLPAAGLLFPLSVRGPGEKTWNARTLLSVNELEKRMTFTGPVPQGHFARFLRANADRLIDGATAAADACRDEFKGAEPELAVLISDVGRKMVLRERAEEEVQGARRVLGRRPVLTGFYAYGEISSFPGAAAARGRPGSSDGAAADALNNHTMAITTLGER